MTDKGGLYRVPQRVRVLPGGPKTLELGWINPPYNVGPRDFTQALPVGLSLRPTYKVLPVTDQRAPPKTVDTTICPSKERPARPRRSVSGRQGQR